METKTTPKSSKSAKLTTSRKSTRGRKQSSSIPKAYIVAIVILGVLTVVLVANLLIKQAGGTGAANVPISANLANIPDDSVVYTSLGQEHIEVGSSHVAYNSNPPTSGPHYAEPANIGIYSTTLADETLVHNLEHGHIWLSYRDANDQDAINLLTQLQKQNPAWVIVTYRPLNASRIAIAAWTRLLTLDELNADKIQAFIQRYANHAPESIPG